MNENEEKTSQKGNWLILLFSVIGVVLSVISFLVYYNIGYAPAVIGICVVDIVFSYFNARLLFKSNDWKGVKQVFIPIMMFVYWVVVLGIVCVGNAILFDGGFSNQLLLYPVFLMPAFIFELLLFCLVLMGS